MQPTITLLHGDSLALLNAPEGLRSPEEGQPGFTTGRAGALLRADACVTDPPYGFDFSGLSDKKWDTFKMTSAVRSAIDDARVFQKWTEAWSRPLNTEVLLSGAAIAMFGMDRAIHRAVSGLEDAGFEIRHGFVWLYATGQVKQKHNLRPALEPFVIGRKPIGDDRAAKEMFAKTGRGQLYAESLAKEDGRHPSNIIVEDGLIDPVNFPEDMDEIDRNILKATPFWYVPKPSAREREMFLEDCAVYKKESFRFQHQRLAEEEKGSNMVHNHHPTVKPIALMRRIIRMVTRRGPDAQGNLHTVIDPFMGSGTTGIAAVLEGCNFIGIEREPDFFDVAKNRILGALKEVSGGV